MHYLNVNNLTRTQSLDTVKSQNSDARIVQRGTRTGQILPFLAWTGRSASSVSDYEFHA